MTFIYTKSKTLRKKQEIYVSFLVWKNPDTLRYAIVLGIFEIGGGGGIFINKKTIHFALNFNMQKTMRYLLRFYTKSQTLCVKILFVKKCTLSFVFISKTYCIVYSDT